jgi:hypothetical protein
VATDQPRELHRHRPFLQVSAAPIDDRLVQSSRWPSWRLDAVRIGQQAIPPTPPDELAGITLPDHEGPMIRSELLRIASPPTPAAAPKQERVSAERRAR